MNPATAVVLAALTLAAAVYAQLEIPRFTASRRAALLTRLGLGALGAIFGFVVADNLAQAGSPALLLFLLGFGAVHVPAAFILLLKRAAGAGRS